jgi:hypothetical protein
MNIARLKSSSDNRALNFELGDVLFFFYLLTFTRQCFWQIGNNTLAWLLTVVFASSIWILYLKTRPLPATRFGKTFWLVVAVPLLLIYLLRLAFPDRSFDVLGYHIIHGQRSLGGSLLWPNDYLHSVPFNSAPDVIMGISRLFLGIRLGTAINLLVLIWSAQLVDKLLRPVVQQSWLRSASVLLIVLSENLLFELNTYMVDLLTLPLLLHATLLTIDHDDSNRKISRYIHIALFLGICATLKLTTLFVALPLLGICAYQMLFVKKERLALKEFPVTVGLMALAFLGPLLPFTIYIYRITGNPLFPLLNTVFKSPYWPTHGGWDGRWGPVGIMQTLLWPILIFFKPERLSELGLYSGRLSLAFVVAFVALIAGWRNVKLRALCLVLISSALLWSAGAVGYIRYGFFQEVLAGIVLVVVAFRLIGAVQKVAWQTVLAGMLFVLIAAQSVVAISYTLQKEWGGRPTVLANPREYARELRYVLRDRSVTNFLSTEDRDRFGKVGVWLETAPKSSAFEVWLNPAAPVIAVRQDEFFVTRIGWKEFIQKVDVLNGQGMYSLCLPEDLVAAKQAILQRGLEVGAVTAFEFPFFSRSTRIGMMLIEIRVPQDPKAREEFATAWLKGAFAPADYREEIIAVDPPATMKAGSKVDIKFKVRNLGSETWPAVGAKDFRYQINMGNHWIKDGARSEDNRAVMKGDLAPGAETEIVFTVNVPVTPGSYSLEMDMVHEGVTWFKERGARPLTFPVTVVP